MPKEYHASAAALKEMSARSSREGNATVTTITFAEHDGKTTLTMHQTYTFESAATRGAKQGWTMTLDQLGEHLEQA